MVSYIYNGNPHNPGLFGAVGLYRPGDRGGQGQMEYGKEHGVWERGGRKGGRKGERERGREAGRQGGREGERGR